MTLQEARKLRVGDMVIFYDRSPDIAPGHTYFTTVVDGCARAADLGLVIKLEPGGVVIDWFEEPTNSSWHEVGRPDFGGWEDIEKV